LSCLWLVWQCALSC